MSEHILSIPCETYASGEGLEHLCDSLFWDERTLMANFALYCDDSGTHPESQIAVAACYVGTVDQWKHFNREWSEANDAEDFGVFHMAPFVAHKQRFALPEWQEEAKRERTLRRLIGTINRRARIGFFGVVEKQAYEEEMPSDLKEEMKFGKNHYSFAVRMCLAKVFKWRWHYKIQEPVQFVFDN